MKNRIVSSVKQRNLSQWTQGVADELGELLDAYSDEVSINDYLSQDEIDLLGEALDILTDASHYLSDMYR